MLIVPVSVVCYSSEQHSEPSLHSAAVTEVGWFLVPTPWASHAQFVRHFTAVRVTACGTSWQ